jgi:alanine racemase
MSSLSANSQQVVVIKADAYGNGAIQVATELASQVSMFAVAFLDEVYELRQAGITQEILVLQGPYDKSECLLTNELNIVWMIHNRKQMSMLHDALRYKQITKNNHWIKFDTGMHRLGLMPDEFERCQAEYPRLFHSQTVIATHLSAADEPLKNSVNVQLDRFTTMLSKTDYMLSIANSAANIHLKEARQHWNRMGISLYGSSPFEGKEIQPDLQPVMRLVSEVIATRIIDVGESVGYGDTWVAQRKTKIATVAIGYADGYPRHAPIGTPALFAGQKATLVGRVSMDMLTFDVSDIDEVSIGTEVELWGEHLAINEVARHVGTIGYELMTRVSKRVPRVYLNNE